MPLTAETGCKVGVLPWPEGSEFSRALKNRRVELSRVPGKGSESLTARQRKEYGSEKERCRRSFSLLVEAGHYWLPVEERLDWRQYFGATDRKVDRSPRRLWNAGPSISIVEPSSPRNVIDVARSASFVAILT